MSHSPTPSLSSHNLLGRDSNHQEDDAQQGGPRSLEPMHQHASTNDKVERFWEDPEKFQKDTVATGAYELVQHGSHLLKLREHIRFRSAFEPRHSDVEFPFLRHAIISEEDKTDQSSRHQISSEIRRQVKVHPVRREARTEALDRSCLGRMPSPGHRSAGTPHSAGARRLHGGGAYAVLQRPGVEELDGRVSSLRIWQLQLHLPVRDGALGHRYSVSAIARSIHRILRSYRR
jgi:hypothetical protein